MRIGTVLGLAALVVVAASARGRAADEPYKVLKTEKVGGSGGFDYVYADSDGRKLYIPRMSRGDDAKPRVDVYDLDTLAPVGSIADTRGVHGVAVDPKSGHGFCSSNPVVMFDSKSLATIKTIPVQGNPDGIFVEPATERIYVLSHRDPNVTVLDAKDGSIVGTIDLGGEPEQGQSDGNGHVYIDLENKDAVAAVDASTMKLTSTWDLGGKGGGPAGLGLDAKNGVLFAFCHDPQTCVILSAQDGKVITSLPIGRGVDGGGFNPQTMEAFGSQGDGTLTIIKETSPTEFTVEQTVKTMTGAKTCTLDTKTNHLFLIAAEYRQPSTQQAATQPQGGRRGGRGQMVPGSFTIIEVGK